MFIQKKLFKIKNYNNINFEFKNNTFNDTRSNIINNFINES